MYGLIEIMQPVISRAKMAAGMFLVCPVYQFFSNTKILFVVMYGLIEIM